MKKTLYPKTKRIGVSNGSTITEKLDGSNLGIFKLNDELIFAQRKNVLTYSELRDSDIAYKGLRAWAKDNKESLEDLHNGSGVFGEWLGMGKLKYGDIGRFFIFAKANIDEEYEIRNINYIHEYFKYPFESQVIPECIKIVPSVAVTNETDIESLNKLFDEYLGTVGRGVEGFVIESNGSISKYVRRKNGKLVDHHA